MAIKTSENCTWTLNFYSLDCLWVSLPTWRSTSLDFKVCWWRTSTCWKRCTRGFIAQWSSFSEISRFLCTSYCTGDNTSRFWKFTYFMRKKKILIISLTHFVSFNSGSQNFWRWPKKISKQWLAFQTHRQYQFLSPGCYWHWITGGSLQNLSNLFVSKMH